MGEIEEQVVIDSLAHDGRGVAHVGGKAVFIPGALPGERVSIAKRKKHRNYDEAVLAAVEVPASGRVEPKCAHFGVCGGCSLQHLDSDAQLEFKQRHLFEQLERIGKVSPERVLPPLSGDVWRYRRRARLGAKFVPKKGKTLVGFRERASPFVTDLQRCEILSEPLDALTGPLSELITGLSIRDRVPQIEVAVADNATALVFRVMDPPSEADKESLRSFGARHGVRIYLQSGGIETIRPLEGAGGEGWESLEYRLPEFSVSLRFLPSDFIQVNGALNRLMVSRGIELLAPRPEDRVLDLFCGLGNFTLPLARRAVQVVGVEGEAGLVQRARENAVLNGLDNATFHVANLQAPDVGEGVAWAKQAFDRVLLDPPRTGAQEVLPLIARSGARRVVYISCHPGSLARDAGILVNELGFKLEAAGALDMFPHTAHIEAMSVFTR